MLNCILVDSEPHTQSALHEMIQNGFNTQLHVLQVVPTMRDAIPLIHTLKPDVVFLDTDLEASKGIEVLDYLQPFSFSLVLTGTTTEYALNGLKMGAVDYLLKPILPKDLRYTIDRLIQRPAAVDATKVAAPNGILDIPSSVQSFSKIALPTATGYELENVEDIAYCEGLDNYARITTADGRQIVVSKTLKHLEHVLPSALFFRIHKSTLVNLNYVKSYSRVDGYRVVMLNGKRLDVSHRRNEFLINKILNKHTDYPSESNGLKAESDEPHRGIPLYLRPK